MTIKCVCGILNKNQGECAAIHASAGKIQMELLTLFLIALGLSMDALAVSVSNGICSRNSSGWISLKSAIVFGVFQAAMPIGGFFAGRTFSEAISSLDHWIALILLSIIGGKMIITSVIELRHPENCRVRNRITWSTLIVQGIATSIDAFTIGISFALLQVNIVEASAFIGIVTFACCLPGGVLGRKFGSLIEQRAEIVGGVILIAMGVKIFLDHILGG